VAAVCRPPGGFQFGSYRHRSADNSPNGKPLLIVAHEVSGTATIYQINKN
jgi:hypothetical protein